MTADNVRVTRDEKNWEVEVAAEIKPEALEKHRADALNELQKTAKLDGFRPGKVPQEKIVEIYGEEAVMRHAAERAIQAEIPEIFASENLFIIETPRVQTDSPILGKALAFTARAGLAPKVELPDYASIGKKHQEIKEDTTVTDEEYNGALLHLRRERARIDKIESGVEAVKAGEEAKAMSETELPALDDAFAQSIGYDSADAFMQVLRENMKTEKDMQLEQKRRGAILDELVKEAKISYPAILREYELDDLEARLADDLARSGVDMERYLADVKKTREELRKSWETGADSRVKVRLILAEIAREKKLDPSPEVVEHELDHAMEHYPKADREQIRPSVINALRNEMTLRFLEGNPEPVGHTGHEH